MNKRMMIGFPSSEKRSRICLFSRSGSALYLTPDDSVHHACKLLLIKHRNVRPLDNYPPFCPSSDESWSSRCFRIPIITDGRYCASAFLIISCAVDNVQILTRLLQRPMPNSKLHKNKRAEMNVPSFQRRSHASKSSISIVMHVAKDAQVESQSSTKGACKVVPEASPREAGLCEITFTTRPKYCATNPSV